MILNEIIKVLEKKFTVTNKEEWDNVGLMIGRRQNEIKFWPFIDDLISIGRPVLIFDHISACLIN